MIIELKSERARATVSTRGATLMSWQVDGVDVLDGYRDEAEHETLDGYRSAVLAPWPNRVCDGRWNDDGVIRDLRDAGNYDPQGLHGLVVDHEFDVVSRDDDTLRLASVIEPTAGYPYRVRITVAFHIGGNEISVTVAGENLSDVAAPIGLGWHPYFHSDLAGKHGAWDAKASHWVAVDDRGIPLVAPFHEFTGFDPVPSKKWDNALAGVEGAIEFPVATGRVRLEANLVSEDLGVGVWHIFTGSTLARARYESVAVEPCTVMADSLNRFRNQMLVDAGDVKRLDIVARYKP